MSVLNAAIAARQSPNGRLFLALDVEAWEQDHSKITEIGWTLYDPRKPVDSQMWARHFIVTENARRINSRYVPDHRHSFNFGVTRMLLLDQIVDLLLVDLKRADCVLIGHALKGDLEFLEEVGLSPAVYVSESYDTSPMYHAKSGKHQAGLKEMCTTFGIPTKHLHNAGKSHCI
ncbi:hypothetical protein DFS34DRAFT_584697 [Phlyctochytrium arcticum]|nr:hypothetical protein DFS34DRAFT_584697 [Phlyctochytrium arcticum]